MLTQPFGSNLEIYVDENFLLEEELLYFDSVIENANQNNLWAGEDGSTSDTGTWKNRNLRLEKHKEEHRILQFLENRILKTYSENIKHIPAELVNQLFRGLGPINRTGIGQNLPVHDDLGPPELNLPVAHGVVLYLNDNFSGGELFYPNLDLKIEPKRGMLVIHSAQAKYAHGVSEVLSGVRYGLTLFVDELKH
jgi:hypothetical protein